MAEKGSDIVKKKSNPNNSELLNKNTTSVAPANKTVTQKQSITTKKSFEKLEPVVSTKEPNVTKLQKHHLDKYIDAPERDLCDDVQTQFKRNEKIDYDKLNGMELLFALSSYDPSVKKEQSSIKPFLGVNKFLINNFDSFGNDKYQLTKWLAKQIKKKERSKEKRQENPKVQTEKDKKEGKAHKNIGQQLTKKPKTNVINQLDKIVKENIVEKPKENANEQKCKENAKVVLKNQTKNKRKVKPARKLMRRPKGNKIDELSAPKMRIILRPKQVKKKLIKHKPAKKVQLKQKPKINKIIAQSVLNKPKEQSKDTNKFQLKAQENALIVNLLGDKLNLGKTVQLPEVSNKPQENLQLKRTAQKEIKSEATKTANTKEKSNQNKVISKSHTQKAVSNKGKTDQSKVKNKSNVNKMENNKSKNPTHLRKSVNKNAKPELKTAEVEKPLIELFKYVPKPRRSVKIAYLKNELKKQNDKPTLLEAYLQKSKKEFKDEKIDEVERKKREDIKAKLTKYVNDKQQARFKERLKEFNLIRRENILDNKPKHETKDEKTLQRERKRRDYMIAALKENANQLVKPKENLKQTKVLKKEKQNNAIKKEKNKVIENNIKKVDSMVEYINEIKERLEKRRIQKLKEEENTLKERKRKQLMIDKLGLNNVEELQKRRRKEKHRRTLIENRSYNWFQKTKMNQSEEKHKETKEGTNTTEVKDKNAKPSSKSEEKIKEKAKENIKEKTKEKHKEKRKEQEGNKLEQLINSRLKHNERRTHHKYVKEEIKNI